MKYSTFLIFFFMHMAYASENESTPNICTILDDLSQQLALCADNFADKQIVNKLFHESENAIKKELFTRNRSSETIAKALFLAAAFGNREIITLLLTTGINPDVYSNHHQTPLMFAAQYGNIETLKALLKHGANYQEIDSQGRTAWEYTHDALEHFGSDLSYRILMISILKYGPTRDPFLECRELLEYQKIKASR